MTLIVVAAGVGIGFTKGRSGRSEARRVAAATAVPTTEPATAVPDPVDFRSIFDREASGVVRIDASTCGGSGVGSGFLVAPDLVATVAHVIDGAVAVALTTTGGTTVAGHVVGVEPTKELALVRSERPLDGTVFTFRSEPVGVGERVAAFGYPLAEPISLTQGAVSGVGRSVTVAGTALRDLIQTDAAINPGNSGGPLVDSVGTVVGLIEAKAGDAEGVGFAIPALQAQPSIDGWRQAQPVPETPCADAAGPKIAPRFGGAVSGPEAAAIGATFAAYFGGIDRAEPETAYAVLGPSITARLSFDSFSASVRTSYDFDIRFVSTEELAPGRALVNVTFTSVQDAAYGPNGDTCDSWDLDYTLVSSPDGWLIDRSVGHNGGPTHLPC